MIVSLSFLAAFFFSVKTGQYEDDYTPSVRMLFDNKTKDPSAEKNTKTTTKKCR
jgi:cbb3-type cytochrome oxidase maturation protein